MSVFKAMPAEVLRNIYEFDDTYKEIFSRTVLTAEVFGDLFGRRMYLDRAYTIRNWCEEGWAIIPRYILREDGRAYGSYIRQGARKRHPL
jgi:hypothetical protein